MIERTAMSKLEKKSKDKMTKENKIRIFETLVFPIFSKSWNKGNNTKKYHQSLEKHISLAITGGARKRKEPSMRWMDDIKSITGRSVKVIKQLAQGRKNGVHLCGI